MQNKFRTLTHTHRDTHSSDGWFHLLLRNRKILGAIFLCLFFLSACEKEEFPATTEESVQSQPPVESFGPEGNSDDIPYVEGSMTILGDLKENPYTVTNMTAAWDYFTKKLM